MKFRNGRDKGFHTAVRERATAYFVSRGVARHGDIRVLVKALVLVSATIGLYALILSNKFSGAPLLLAAMLFGISCILLSFNVAHDAAHDALTRSRFLNQLIYVATFLPNGTSPYLWKCRHVGSHHTFPNVKGGDADMDDNPFLRVTPSSPYRSYFRYQHLYAPLVYMLFSPFTIFIYDWQFFSRDRLANMDLRHDLRHLRVMAIVAAEKLVYFTLVLGVPLLVIDQPWWAIALGFGVMQCAASLAFTLPLVSTHIADEIAFPEADADGYVDGSWSTHQLATSMDYSPDSHAANWFLGAVNAHAAHHLFPDVCHVHYVALSKIIRETAQEFGVPYHAMPFRAAIRSHFRLLKRLGQRPVLVPIRRQPTGAVFLDKRSRLRDDLRACRLDEYRVLVPPCPQCQGRRNTRLVGDPSVKSEIIIVSGLPRSGTSLMMQMLVSGGVEPLTDVIREADIDNPRGYYEFERVKKIKEDSSWIPESRGKAVKMVSQLLYDIPISEKYLVIFMERDLDEVLVSQEKMLIRLNRPVGDRDQMKLAFTKHLDRLRAWLATQPHIAVLYLRYNELVASPEGQAERVSTFLSGQVDVQAMAAAVDPTLYRNRKTFDNEQAISHDVGPGDLHNPRESN